MAFFTSGPVQRDVGNLAFLFVQNLVRHNFTSATGVNPWGWTPSHHEIGAGREAFLFLFLRLSKQLSGSAFHPF